MNVIKNISAKDKGGQDKTSERQRTYFVLCLSLVLCCPPLSFVVRAKMFYGDLILPVAALLKPKSVFFRIFFYLSNFEKNSRTYPI